jgi:hypothetical protein
VPKVTASSPDRGYAGAGRVEEMSSEVLVLAAMLVTIVAATWWALAPVSTDAHDRSWLADDAFDADAA